MSSEKNMMTSVADAPRTARTECAQSQGGAEVATVWIVSCGSAGVAPSPVFDNEADAIARYEREISTPSYFGPDHRRRASVIKRTTIVEDVTPARCRVSDVPAKHEDAAAAEPEGGQRGGDSQTPSPSLPETTGSEAKPSDWVLVPREPTEAILDAFWHQAGESKEMRSRVHVRARHYWRAMIDAASPLPTGTDYAGPIERLRVVAEALSNNGYESHPITQAAQALCTAQQERDTLQQKNKELERHTFNQDLVIDRLGGERTLAQAEAERLRGEVDRLSVELEALKGRKFPIMGGPSIPWFIIAPWDGQAQKNHNQSLERLAQRGGLSPCEAVAVLMGRKWERMDEAKALAVLQKIVEIRTTRTALSSKAGETE